MSYYYPRAAMQLRVLPEDYGLSSDASKEETTVFNVQCRDVVVNRNDYKTADTFTAEVDYKSFPFDPRTIRACGVVIYMQDMGKNYNDDGSLAIIQPGAETAIDPTISNAVFIGFVDEDEIIFDDLGRKVMFTGRDCTALLIDQKYTSVKAVPHSPDPLATKGAKITSKVVGPFFPNQPLNIAIQNLLSTFPATQSIRVYASPGVVMPIMSTYDPAFGNKLAGGMNTGGGKRESYWDIIQDLAGRAGLICYMGISSTADGQIAPTIFLVTPKDQGLDINLLTGQTNTETLDDIKIIYGQNVKNLKFKRKIGRMKNFNIQVISRNQKEVISAKIPEEATIAWLNKYDFPLTDGHGTPALVPKLRPDGTIDDTSNQYAPYITFPYPKIGSKAALIQIAQTLYEQYSLQQLEGEFTTWEMLGRGTTKDSNLNDKYSYTAYDLTQIKKGQTICIEMASPDIAAISRFPSNLDRVYYLTERGYDPNLAILIATTIQPMSARFQIKSYRMHIGQDTGWELTVEFYNLIDNTNRMIGDSPVSGTSTSAPVSGNPNLGSFNA